MGTVNYKTPLQFSKLLEGNELPTCSLFDSVTKNLELIITTRFGEHRCDPTFGCEIWDLDFELIVSENLWEEKLRQSLLRSVNCHEKRLGAVQLTVEITEIEKFHLFKKFTEIKKRVEIKLTGTLYKTGEPFSFKTNLFLSPLSAS